VHLHERGRSSLPFMAACGTAILFASSSAAQWFHPLDYFVNTTQGVSTPTTCTAHLPGEVGSYNRIFEYSAAHCPGVRIFIWHKGTDPPWAEEHFAATGDGFIRLLDETGHAEGFMDRSMVLYDNLSPGGHGLRVFVDGLVNGYAHIDHAGYYVSFWGGNTCPSTHLERHGPFEGQEENIWIGEVSSWLYDCRAGRPCWAGPAYPIEVIQRSGGGKNPGDPTDHFWFARWKDPLANYEWRGLGFVKFWCTGDEPGGWCANPGELRALVDCDSTPVCYACPEP
jgi:hypothetical protein